MTMVSIRGMGIESLMREYKNAPINKGGAGSKFSYRRGISQKNIPKHREEVFLNI